MTSKERLMCALNREKPDRLPVSVHQWQGYHLDKYLNGISDVEAFRRFGMDGQMQYFEDMGQFWLVDSDYSKASTPQWRDEVKVVSNDPENRITHHTITTPEGVLTCKTGGDRKTTWITEYLIKNDEDREFCLPYDRKMHDALHELGFKVTYHTCGDTLDIEEYIVANGCDASETLSARSLGGNQEPWEYKEKIGDRLVLIGGMDQFNVLTRGNHEEIRTQVKTLFEKVGYQGGYILSCTDHFFETPVENIKAYADAARECTYS